MATTGWDNPSMVDEIGDSPDAELPDSSGADRRSDAMHNLRRKAALVDQQRGELDTLRRENALLKAGLGDLNDAQHKALFGAHEDGEITAEALKATWQELGLPITVEPQVPHEEQAAHARAFQTMAGAEPADAHPMTVNDELKAAQSTDEVVAILRRENALASS